MQSGINTSNFSAGDGSEESGANPSSVQYFFWNRSRSANFSSRPGSSFFRWCEAHADIASKIGFLLCVIAYALIAAYGLSQNGQWESVRQAVFATVNNVAVAAGLEVGKVTVDGQVNLTEAEVAAALGTQRGVSILSFDTAAARDRLKAYGWVREARVTRLLPSTLYVELEEKAPFALWREGGQIAAIDIDGKQLSLVKPGAFGELPVVSGPGAALPAKDIVAALRAFPELNRRITDIERIAGRRWDLVLDTGMRAKLPAEKYRQALAELNVMAAKNASALYDIAEIDFRVPTQFTVRLKDGSDKARNSFLSGLAKTNEGHNSEM